MKLSNDAIAEFERNGILILPKLFSESEVDRLIDALQPLMREETPANIREKSSGEVRTAMGLHLRSEVYSRLVRHPRLIEPAAQILGGEPLYIQQVKVNIKPAFGKVPKKSIHPSIKDRCDVFHDDEARS